MNDLISRQAAIDAIGERPSACIESEYDHEYENGLQNQWERDMTAIKILPSAQSDVPDKNVGKWIPCSERLPGGNGRYLVTRGLNACGSLWNRTYIVNYSDLFGIKKERIWWQGNLGKSDFERLEDVLAWMPLPEPYKEG